MSESPQPDLDIFRVLLFRNDARELLLETANEGLRLPSIEIPRYSRVGEEVTRAIEAHWGLIACCLFCLPEDASHPNRYQVAELYGRAVCPGGMNWIPVVSVVESNLVEHSDFSAIQASLAAVASPCDDKRRRLFGKPGWLSAVTEWAHAQVSAMGLRLTGKFRQFSNSPTFALVRFETDGPAVWFKAVGEPNLHEFSITTELARLFPGFLPHVLATRPEWHAWLALEAPGTHLGKASNVTSWKTAAVALAQLQIASLGQGLHLIDAGCRDLRTYRLRLTLTPFLELASELMARQPTSSPPPMSHRELQTLGSQIEDALEILDNTAIANTLGHADPNPHNLLVHEDGCVFLDWSEAFVGHPFLAAAYLVEHLRRDPKDERWPTEVLDAYAAPWRLRFDRDKVIAALEVAPLLAAFAYADRIAASQQRALPVDAETGKLIRSLTRRMRREAEDLRAKDDLCKP
jgi:hypothetical protein